MGRFQFTIKRLFFAVLALSVVTIAVVALNKNTAAVVPISSSIEDQDSEGRIYNPSTQSLLRGHHWLESVKNLVIAANDSKKIGIKFQSAEPAHSLEVEDFPMDLVVPRLHYHPGSPPDAFDAFNLMMAEFSRSGVALPVGNPGDKLVHFQTSLKSEVPYNLEGNYQFVPNRHFKPMRLNVINNCLAPGLWEINATDRTGEIFHGWFNMPPALYISKVADTNRLEKKFVLGALEWSTETAPLHLERLRKVKGEEIETPVKVINSEESPGYSSQDSRRKLAKGYALVEIDGKLQIPENISQITEHPLHLSEFVVPGKYAIDQRREFGLGFLKTVRSSSVKLVEPLTDYGWNEPDKPKSNKARASQNFEITLDLQDYILVIGNLPAHLLVPQEDYSLEGFGVGVLKSGEVIERRQLLVERGHAPSFAYLARQVDGVLHGVNSHEYGMEQIYIRTHCFDLDPWWEITLTSYERIVDIIKYRVNIPEKYVSALVDHANSYLPPLYRTYRDDNLR